jgi:hypothetical protein
MPNVMNGRGNFYRSKRRKGRSKGGISIALFKHDTCAAQIDYGGRQEKYGRQNSTLPALMFEQFQARQQKESQAEKRGYNSAEAKSPKHWPLRGVCQGCQK